VRWLPFGQVYDLRGGSTRLDRLNAFMGAFPGLITGHAVRTQFEVLGTGHRMNAGDMVVRSASLALDRMRAFIEIVDQY
jgi:hypothetical protein